MLTGPKRLRNKGGGEGNILNLPEVSLVKSGLDEPCPQDYSNRGSLPMLLKKRTNLKV